MKPQGKIKTYIKNIFHKLIIFRNTFGNINYFGGPSKHLLRNSQKLKEVMNEDNNKQILFFSDVWLDEPVVCTN